MANSKQTQASDYDNQSNIVFKAFGQFPKTMQEVHVETNIDRANICRYVGHFRDQNRIALIGYRKCKVTGFTIVGEYSTNPDLFPKSNQLQLF